MTTANKLTILRVVMIPVFMAVLLLSFPGSNILALVIFAAASLTDCVDGYIARKYNQVTTFGKFMDPLADKLLVTAAILVFVERGQCPSWAALIIIAREFAVTALRLIAVDNGVVIAAALLGKVKTVLSIIGICLMLTPLHDAVLFAGITVDNLCVAVMVVITVVSGAEYFIRNGKMLNVKK